MKTSFKVIASIIAIAVFTVNTFAQTNYIGLYLTAQDFAHKKLSYSSESSTGIYKIKVASLFSKDRVQVIQNGERHNFSQSDLFGYRDKNNQDYRFFDGHPYKIISTSFFYLYSRVVTVNEGKVHYQKTKYYFSKQPDDNIMDLTIDNLKNTYPDNHKFQDMLDIYFRSNDELSRYDGYNKMYKAAHVFGDSFDKTAYSINK